MHLLVGLGNIGKKYEKTRHNFGFLVLDEIISQFNLEKSGEKFSSELFLGKINDEKIIAIKPQTYMNNSGVAVLEAMQFYKIKPENIIVFHDEIDIDFGRIKTKIGGGSAGHNGLKSIDSFIGKEYWRVRLGVSRPQNKEFEVADYVLSKFSDEEFVSVGFIAKNIAKSLPKFLLERNFE